MGDAIIPFVDTAEHVGVLRSVSGNLPHIHQRMVKHRKALACILFTGMSRRHRTSPLASLRAERIFGSPVLFSGLATLILKKTEVAIVAHHVKETIQNLLKLHQNTPDAFIFMVSGSFPGEATLHLKQLTLFGMISLLPDNILYRIAKEKLLKGEKRSWFTQVFVLCKMYGLPHPLSLLASPPKKEQKHFQRKEVCRQWEERKQKTEVHHGLSL